MNHLPLNALRAFEVSARHLSFTRAAGELNVTQTAVSAQVKNLEQRLGVLLFRRLPRGLALTDEGQALLPMLADSFARMGTLLQQFRGGRLHEVLTVAVVGTFAVGWLMPRLDGFRGAFPFVDLRLLTHNNRVDLAGEGLDGAIRFGDGAWHGTEAEALLDAPLAPVCAPALATRLRAPADLAAETLLRSYRADEWSRWFAAAGAVPPLPRGPAGAALCGGPAAGPLLAHAVAVTPAIGGLARVPRLAAGRVPFCRPVLAAVVQRSRKQVCRGLAPRAGAPIWDGLRPGPRGGANHVEASCTAVDPAAR